MNNYEIPFEYTYYIPTSQLINYEEDFQEFVINSYEFENDMYRYKFSFSSDKKGVIGTDFSGNIRDSFCHYMYGTTYKEVYDYSNQSSDSFYLDYVDGFIRLVLFEIHCMVDFRTSSNQDIYIKKINNNDKTINEALLNKLTEYITLLKMENFDLYSVQLKHSKFLDSDFNFDLKGNSDLQKHLKSFIRQDIKDFLLSIEKDPDTQLLKLAMGVLKHYNVLPLPSVKYLKKLHDMASVLKPNNKTASWNRLFIMLINSLDNLLDLAFRTFYKDIPEKRANNKLYKHLTILHALSIFDLLPTEDKIHKVLYEEDYTKHEVKDAVKDFMRNKIYK
jgi:hypothetical protein